MSQSSNQTPSAEPARRRKGAGPKHRVASATRYGEREFVYIKVILEVFPVDRSIC